MDRPSLYWGILDLRRVLPTAESAAPAAKCTAGALPAPIDDTLRGPWASVRATWRSLKAKSSANMTGSGTEEY
jgi:hypothetical protein